MPDNQENLGTGVPSELGAVLESHSVAAGISKSQLIAIVIAVIQAGATPECGTCFSDLIAAVTSHLGS